MASNIAVNPDKVCLWKKVLENPNNTTTKDSSPEQIFKCHNCPGCPYSGTDSPPDCCNFLEIPV